MEGLIFSIKKYSIHDGPGIRVTFFMKGCPLSCWWCHNPEGISPEIQTVVQTKKIGDREFTSEEQVGRYYSVRDIVGILEKERVFIQQSKGGVTFSGGEPMMQAGFLFEALKACKASGFHTAVDTSGYGSFESYNLIIPYTDLFLFDLKHLEDSKHVEYTGVSNSTIMHNFSRLLKSGKEIILRIPVIPGINDDDLNLIKIRDFILTHKNESLSKICLLPYHRIGVSKYRRFGLPYRMNDTESPSPERMRNLKKFFSETGIKLKIGG